MNDFFKWLVTSSADPAKVSLAIKGMGLSIIPIVMFVTGLADSDVTSIVNGVADVVAAIFAIVSAVMTVKGVLRKIDLQRWSSHS